MTDSAARALGPRRERFGRNLSLFGLSGSRAAAAVLVAGSIVAFACAPAERQQQSAAVAEPGTGSAAESAERAPRAIATDIEASKTSLRAETRTGSSGGVAISETRYYVGNALVLVEEIVGSPDAAQSAAAYYIDDDRLVFFRGRGTRTIFVPGSEERSESFDIEIGYDADGNVVDSSKLISGSPAELEPLDYEAPKVRAGILLNRSGEE